MNQAVVESGFLNDRFHFDILPLSFATEIADVGTFRPQKVLIGLRIAWDLLVRILRFRPDLVYFTLCPTGGGFLRDLLYVFIIKCLRVPRILHLHGVGVRQAAARSWPLRRLYAWAFSGANVVHLSRALFRDVEAFVPSDRLFAVPNGLRQSEALDDLALRTDRTGPARLAFMSSMAEAKGPLVLLDALKLLRERNVAFQCRFAGPWRDEGTKVAFEGRVADYGLQGCVEYVGVVRGAEKDLFLREADVFVFPTLWEAFGLVAVEAMAHALPVVASREGALVEIVADGETGLLVPKNEADALADALARLVGDPQLRVKMGQAGRKRYETNYRLEIFEQRLADAVQESLIRKRPTPNAGRG